ncbi:MAG: hypothetical protein MR303_03450 [Emergencia sp.]|nr:hypothetical protein [Emergencia sp.]
MKKLMEQYFKRCKRRGEETLETYLNPKPTLLWNEIITNCTKSAKLSK